MMTPSELREYEFKGAGRNAYKADDVDIFFGEVAVAYEKIYRENVELLKRVSMLADRLEQFKKDEAEIKQAVIGAQKAADIIVKEAEMAVEDSRVEADAILAAAKGEADIIKSDAEKQAIADSDLLLSIARDKAESIINKAKEEAHGILIEANNSANDTVGAATRTITSESIHYEMLKKEVSEFRASVLAQYKAHIEMISKLPELAVEEAKRLEPEKETESDDKENIVEELTQVDPENDIVEFIDEDEEAPVDITTFSESADTEEEEYVGEEVVKTTLPYDFFEENPTLEFINEPETDDNEDEDFDTASDDDDAENDVNSESQIVPETDTEAQESEEDAESIDDEEDDEKNDDFDESANEPADIPITKGFSVDPSNLNLFEDSSETIKKDLSLFDSFEYIDTNNEFDEDDSKEEESKKKRGFFRRKK